MDLIILLVIGALAGWLAGVIMKGYGFGVIINIVLGIVGAYVGNFALGALGVSLASGNLGYFIHGTIGAVIILFIIGLIKK